MMLTPCESPELLVMGGWFKFFSDSIEFVKKSQFEITWLGDYREIA
jgi:hypothetical protein